MSAYVAITVGPGVKLDFEGARNLLRRLYAARGSRLAPANHTLTVQMDLSGRIRLVLR